MGVPNLTGVLVATVRNPSQGPGARLINGLKCQGNDGVGRAAPRTSFHAGAAPQRDMGTDPNPRVGAELILSRRS